MKIERGKQPYRIADVETTTAVLEALRWERDNNTPLFADVQTRLHAARLARAAYQRHLLKRFVALITSRLRWSDRSPGKSRETKTLVVT